MLIKEVKESLKRKKTFAFFIMLGVTLFLTTVTILFMSYIHIQEKEGTVSSFEGLNVYQISDTLYEDQDYQSYLNEPDALDRVKRLYTYLEEDLNDLYVYVFEQPIVMPLDNIDVEQKFIQGYEDGNPWPPSERDDGGTYYSLKAVQLNEQAADIFPLPVSEGTSFSAQDFNAEQNNGVIPVLLGADYADIYEVGDVLEAGYLWMEFLLEVKGFVDAEAFVYREGFPEIYLDRYIVMPAQQFGVPANDEELAFQERHYFQIINGSIYSTEERDVVAEQLEQAKQASDFPHTGMLGEPTTPLGHLYDAIEEYINMILVISFALLAGSVLSISILMMKKIQDNYKNMMIHLISGGTMKQLFRYVLGEVLVLVGMPSVLIIVLHLTLYPRMLSLNAAYIALVTACALGMMVLSTIPIYIQFLRLPISNLLKREE